MPAPEGWPSGLESQELCTGSIALLSYSGRSGIESQGSKELASRNLEPSLSNWHPSLTWHLAPEGVLAARPDFGLPILRRFLLYFPNLPSWNPDPAQTAS